MDFLQPKPCGNCDVLKIKRMHLFEIEDQNWCPEILRQSMTEFLLTVTRLSKIWTPTAGVLQDLLKKSEANQVVVLGAGSGGGILDVAPRLPQDTKIILTDLYPHQSFESPFPNMDYYRESVNAAAVPQNLKGLRVLYMIFHHLTPEMAKKVLGNSVRDRQPIAIFEATERSIRGILAMILVPIVVLLVTPFIRPFKWSRLLLTYVLPILPLVIFWDGFVSALRTYSLCEMRDLVAEFSDYEWRVEVLRGPHGERIPMMTGVPV